MTHIVRSDVSWDAYFMEMAHVAAKKSKDPSTKVGCVIVGPDRAIRMTGYNGPPPGVHDLSERFERPAKYLFVLHAEASALGHAARNGVSMADCTMYVTHFCCNECSKLIIASGIREIKYGSGTTSMPPELFEASKAMLHEAGVTTKMIAEEC